MKNSTQILAGLGGALVLNLVHEFARHGVRDAPHVQEIAEQGIDKIVDKAGLPKPEGNTRYGIALAGDIVANTVYYAQVGYGKNGWTRGIALGLIGGIGTVLLPEKLGFDDRPVSKTTTTKILTIVWYTLGGITAAALNHALRREATA